MYYIIYILIVYYIQYVIKIFLSIFQEYKLQTYFPLGFICLCLHDRENYLNVNTSFIKKNKSCSSFEEKGLSL